MKSFQASEQIKFNTEMQEKQAEMKVQYDALLEMFGQKVRNLKYLDPLTNLYYQRQVEEYEELKLDLVDLKSISHIQKAQINELTQKLNDARPTWKFRWWCNDIFKK